MRAHTRTGLALSVTACCLALLAGCAGSPKAPEQATASEKQLPSDGLENLYAFAPNIYSGGEPSGERGYATLEKLGVKTVICVDAMPPPAELARQHGIRVIHVPIGYDSVPERASTQIAKALTEIDGPVYLHCHHGKHRGPAALASGAVVAGIADRGRALEFMHQAGTADIYTGLWASVGSVEPADPAELYLVEPDLPERADIGGYPGVMASIDRAWDRVKIAQKNGWRPTPDHPDLAPGNDLALIHDLLRSLRTDEVALSHGPPHEEILERSIKASGEAERAYKAGDADGASRAYTELAASCKDCHNRYRN